MCEVFQYLINKFFICY